MMLVIMMTKVSKEMPSLVLMMIWLWCSKMLLDGNDVDEDGDNDNDDAVRFSVNVFDNSEEDDKILWQVFAARLWARCPKSMYILFGMICCPLTM